jgi:hypothetical protein
LAAVNPIDRLRRAVAGKDVIDDAVARQNVSDFIAALRDLGETEGPWAFARWLEAPEDTERRQIAYLLVWRDGPNWTIWPDLNRLDAVDLTIDALVEGFDAFLAVYPTQ